MADLEEYTSAFKLFLVKALSGVEFVFQIQNQVQPIYYNYSQPFPQQSNNKNHIHTYYQNYLWFCGLSTATSSFNSDI